MRLLFPAFLLAAIFASYSCSTNLTVKNSTGAAATVSYDGAGAETVANGSSAKKVYNVGFFEASKVVAVKGEGIYLSITSNVTVNGISDVEVTFSANRGSVKVVNNSGRTITNVSISPTSSTTWGSNWLGSSTISSTVGTETHFGVTAGTWDIKIVDASYVGQILGFSVAVGATTTRTYGTSTISAPSALSVKN